MKTTSKKENTDEAKEVEGNHRKNDPFIGVSESNKKVIEKYLIFRQNVTNKSIDTLATNKSVLCRFAKFLAEKDFRDATTTDMQKYFGTFNKPSSQDTHAMVLITFLRWHLDLRRKQRPIIMAWYEYEPQRSKRKRRDPNAKDKFFIFKDDYDAIIRNETDLQNKALWETLYLSGARSKSEILKMRIRDVFDDGQIVTVTLVDSKTIPRNIPLPGDASYLLRWLEEHPLKENPDAPLWISPKSKIPLYYTRLHDWFVVAKEKANITKPYTIKCFRKTRASIIFDSKEFTDSEIASIMGWEVSMVPFRRREYDLTSEADLRNKIIGKLNRPPTRDELSRENAHLRKNAEEMIQTKVEELLNSKMKNINEMLKSKWYQVEMQPYTEKYQLPNKETVEFKFQPKQKDIDVLLKKYINNKKEMAKIKKIGLYEWSKLKLS